MTIYKIGITIGITKVASTDNQTTGHALTQIKLICLFGHVLSVLSDISVISYFQTSGDTMNCFIVSMFCLLMLMAVTKPGKGIYLTGGDYEDKLMNDSYFNPQYYDVMLTDLDYAKISDISRVDLGFEHNSATSSKPSFPITGIVAVAPTYGRTVGGIILKYEKKSIKSFVVFDTGAPGVYLCDRTFRSLGIDLADHANVIVHGKPTGVLRSTGHFKEVNVLGAS
jgi:hypothetical protein